MASNKAPLLLFVLLLLAACHPGVPKQYIQPDEMEDLLYDYHLSQAMARNTSDSAEVRNYNQTLYFAAVLEKHGVTKADFDSSLIYYYNRADRLEKIYKKVAARLSDEAMRLGASEGEVNRYNMLTTTGDTANVWEGNSTVMLMPYAPYNRLDFQQTADTTYQKDDAFILYFETAFCFQSGSKEAVATMSVVYDNDSVVSRSIHVGTSGINQLRIPAVEDHVAKEIKGFFYLGPGSEQSTTLKLMYIHDLQLIRFHKQPEDTTKVNSTDGTTVIDKPLHETTGINTGTPTPSTLSPNQSTMQPTEAPAPKKLRKTPPPLPKKEVEQAPPRHGQLELGPPARRRDENAPKNIEQPIQVAPTRRR